ncbi:MAG: bacillithiol biosynthesis BshC [Gemmatimonadaceae bacterium]
MIRAISRDVGGSALARSALDGGLADWYASRPTGVGDWSAVADATSAEFAGRAWLDDLLPALQPSGPAAERLRAAAGTGVVVTGGQQPGLFGGPLYVLNKAITMLEVADALQVAISRPVAPIFWAATDDADFVEASHVGVVRRGKLDALTMVQPDVAGRSMANTPLGDVSEQMSRLEEACGSASAAGALEAVRNAYTAGSSVGSAYVTLLRSLLEPLGIAVLDASHPAVRAAGHKTVRLALDRADAVTKALTTRSKEIAAAGFHTQVADVPNLSLVFETLDDGTRRRVPLITAASVSKISPRERLGPNVLLRPVMERQILPTVCYIGGPGEVAYFAQVSAVAHALDLAVPRIVPRWSGTLIESQIETILDRLAAEIADFADPHAMETRIAREGVSSGIRDSIAEFKSALDDVTAKLRGDAQTSEALARSIGTMRAGVEHRLARLERRYSASIKQAGTEQLRDVALVRATLYPAGDPQERVLSYVPFLARYGGSAIDAIRVEARRHVAGVIHGD